MAPTSERLTSFNPLPLTNGTGDRFNRAVVRAGHPSRTPHNDPRPPVHQPALICVRAEYT